MLLQFNPICNLTPGTKNGTSIIINLLENQVTLATKLPQQPYNRKQDQCLQTKWMLPALYP